MSTRSVPIVSNESVESSSSKTGAAAYVMLAGRILFSLIFVLSGFSHFSSNTITFAAQHGVPGAGALVPISGLMAIIGGLSVAFGYQARWGAWLLVLFLVPVTLSLHNFWAEKDPMMFQIQFAMFMKNVSMLGAALFISQVERKVQ